MSLTPRTRGWSAGQRIAALATVLALLTGLAGLTAVLVGRADSAPEAGTVHRERPPETERTKGAVPSPPATRDPVAFAGAAADALWSYDTRAASRGQQLAGLKAWMTSEEKYADFPSIAQQVPDPVLWSRMRDQHQHATATVAESHLPRAFKAALEEDPGALREAYVYAVTVTGKQAIAWQGGGAGAEERAITLAVQCRPAQPCALASIAPTVSP